MLTDSPSLEHALRALVRCCNTEVSVAIGDLRRESPMSDLDRRAVQVLQRVRCELEEEAMRDDD